jgi:hypothetical protein
MDQAVLGKILATVITAAVDAGAITLSSGKILTDAGAVGALVQGFLSIWLAHPASGSTAAPATAKG